MNHSITHVMVLVDPDVDSLATQLAAVRLASGSGALVTLLHIDERYARIQATSQLDAIENLHRVLFIPRDEAIQSPTHSEVPYRRAIKRLHEMRDQLIAVGPEDVHIRVAYRRGEAQREASAFIDEAGVDVVFIQSPASCRSTTLRRLARTLHQHCACQIQTVHPPNLRSNNRNSFVSDWWSSVIAPWRKLSRPA